MGVFDYINQRGLNTKYAKDLTEAEEMFNAQKEAIQSLKDSQGLQEIVAYWERQKEINENMFENAKENKDMYFALYKQSKMFLQFIGNLLE